MEVILLERVEKLGAIGDVVKVKDGFARNYLLPRKKALRANESNRKLFEANRARIEEENAEKRSDAEKASKGVDGKSVSELAKSAPSGRSLAVPLHVLGSLVARGLPSDEALAKVLERLNARAEDAQLAQLPEQVGSHPTGKPDVTGPDLAGTKRPPTAGPPAGVPANGGARTVPATPNRPAGRP